MKDGKFVILCVDDDPDILQTLQMVLEKNGYVMAGANSAEEGLKRYREGSPDLVIVDLMMEKVDAGTSLVTQLRAEGTKVPVYMLSSVGDELHGTINTQQLGLAGVFQKPIDPRFLIDTLKTRLKAA